jgi:hypothetical protein
MNPRIPKWAPTLGVGWILEPSEGDFRGQNSLD